MKPNSVTCPTRMLVVLAALVSCVVAGAGGARGEEGTVDTAYHTPLAGEAKEAIFLGRKVPIPFQDRGHLTSITLGGSYLWPKQGSSIGVPVGAVFIRRVTDEYRSRDTISAVVNELELDKRYDRFEIVGHFENYTLPVDIRELRENNEVRGTSLQFGSLMASLGPGLRFDAAPYEIDNDFRLQLLGRIGYQYADRTHETGADVVVPPSTMVYGVRLRAHYDGLARNLLELPHRGLAFGFDLDYLQREHWRDLSPGSTGSGNREYLQAKGYLVGAGGIPGLSERDRVLISLKGGATTNGDRFNAFLINGGPFPSETDDLIRPHYTGILYNDIRATNYATAALGYRRELTFFLYLSLVGSYIWGDRAVVQGADQVVFRSRNGVAGTVSLDCAFFWNSELYLAFTRESDFIREGKTGNGAILLWSKAL